MIRSLAARYVRWCEKCHDKDRTFLGLFAFWIVTSFLGIGMLIGLGLLAGLVLSVMGVWGLIPIFAFALAFIMTLVTWLID